LAVCANHFLCSIGIGLRRSGSGAVLWRYPLNYNSTSVAASPVIAGNWFIVRELTGFTDPARLAGAAVVSVTNSDGIFQRRQCGTAPTS